MSHDDLQNPYYRGLKRLMVTCHSNVSIFAVRSEIMACDITMLFTATDHSDIMISCGLFLDRYSPFLTEHCLGVSKFSLPVNGDNDMPVVGKHIASILHQILHTADCNRCTTEDYLPRCPSDCQEVNTRILQASLRRRLLQLPGRGLGRSVLLRRWTTRS